MKFPDALKSMQQGRRVRRPHWHNNTIAFFVPAHEVTVTQAPLLGLLPAGARVKIPSHFATLNREHEVTYYEPNADDLNAEDWSCHV